MKKCLSRLYVVVLMAIVLVGFLYIFNSHQVAHAQSECIDPATGLPCAPAPTCGLPGLPPCEPPPPSCGVAGMPPCEPPPSKPDPTRTPRPRPTRTPTPTAIISCDTNYLTAVLAGANEVPAVLTEGQGTVKLFLDLNNGTITGNWQVSNLSGLITASHIHDGPAGVKAGVFIPFSGLPLGGSFATVDKASAAQMQAILDDPSHFYVNVHSTTYPGGEIRGQLACAPAEPISSPTPTSLPTATASATSIPTPSPTPKPFISVKQKPPGIFKPVSFVMPYLVSQPDIEIVKIEITQAIQCLDNPNCADNSVWLYTGKPTMARVYVRLAPGAFTKLTNIEGVLCRGERGIEGCGKIIKPSLSVRSLNKVTVRRDASIAEDRGNINATLNFLIPPGWVNTPAFSVLGVGEKFTVTAYVNYFYKDYVYETKYDNNFTVAKAQLARSQPLGLMFVPVSVRGPKSSNYVQASASEMHSIMNWLRLVYPTSDFRFGYVPGYYNWKTDWEEGEKGSCGSFGGLLNKLTWNRQFDQRLWYGMVDINAKSLWTKETNVGGCGSMLYGVSAGFVGFGDRTTGQIAAQEFAHNLHREHAPGCEAGNPDSKYPMPDGRLDEFGLDVLRQQIYKPNESFDYMGYCGSEYDTWTSIYSYREIAARLPNGGYSTVASHAKLASLTLGNPGDRAYFTIDGTISPDGVDVLDGFYRMDVSSGEFPKLEDGPFAIELLDANGEIIYSQSFAPTGNSNDEHHDPPLSGYFFLALPWDENVREARFTYQGNELNSIKASRRAPKAVWVSTGEDGQSDTGSLTVAWETSDQDGDPLQVQIEYSPDDGSTWTVLATNPDGNSLEINSSSLIGGDSAKLRLRVTDGFSTTTVDSELFQVGNKPPEAYISWPEDGAQNTAETPIYLTALGLDLEDGSIDPETIRWSSDINGELGLGDQLVDSLSVGQHILTAHVIDSAGAIGEAKVSITILPAEPAQDSEATLDPKFERTMNYAIVGVMIIVLVIAGLLVTLVVLWRRARQ
jgi:CHRD domain